jgi:hypothetical protein
MDIDVFATSITSGASTLFDVTVFATGAVMTGR